MYRTRKLQRTAAIIAATLATTFAGTAPAIAEPSAFAANPSASASVSDETPPQPSPSERAAAATRPAIVYLNIEARAFVVDQDNNPSDADNNPANGNDAYVLPASCTGFGINPAGFIATAGHCVDISTTDQGGWKDDFLAKAIEDASASMPNMSPEDIKALAFSVLTVEGTSKGAPIDLKVTVAAAGAQPVPARVVDYRSGDDGDVALLKVDATDLPSVLLATDANVQVGTPILSIGYPGAVENFTDPSLEPSNKDGTVSQKRTQGNTPVYEISAAMGPGMSGGPAVDMSSRVLGINSFSPAGETQQFNFLAPSGVLADMLNKNGVRNELGPDDNTYRAALDSFYVGRYTEAIAGFDRVLQVNPRFAQAGKFKADALRSRERYGDTSTLPFGLAPVPFWSILAAVGAVLLGLTTTVLLRSRKARRQLASPASATPVPGQPVSPPVRSYASPAAHQHGVPTTQPGAPPQRTGSPNFYPAGSAFYPPTSSGTADRRG